MESLFGRNLMGVKGPDLASIVVEIGFPRYGSSECKALKLLGEALGVKKKAKVGEATSEKNSVVTIEWLSGKVLAPAVVYDRWTTIGGLLKIIAPLVLGDRGESYAEPYLCRSNGGGECSIYSKVESFIEMDDENNPKPLKLNLLTRPFKEGRLDYDPLLDVLNGDLTANQLARVVEINQKRKVERSPNKVDYRVIIKKYAEMNNFKEAIKCTLMENSGICRTNALATILSQITKSTSAQLTSLWEIVDKEDKPLDTSKQILLILRKYLELKADIGNVTEIRNRINALFFFREDALKLLNECLQ